MLDAVADCLNKLNAQNKRLLTLVERLTESVNKHNSNCHVESLPTPKENVVTPKQTAILESVSNRLEKIEQDMNSNVLICRSPGVSELISHSTAGTVVNHERLKGDLCKFVCGDDIVGVHISSLQVSLFGRNRNSVKINSTNSSSRLHLLKQARRRKPEGIFVSEFLTKANLSLFYNLRQLKKQNPSKITSVFTRAGGVLYRLAGSDQAHRASSIEDLSSIIDPDPNVNLTAANTHTTQDGSGN